MSPARLACYLITFFCFTLTARTTPAAPAIDFSSVGYAGDGSAPPAVQSVLLVRPGPSDDTALLQAALDRAAEMPVAANGFRGAVALAPGTFHVSGQLVLKDDGVVLRGAADHGTTIMATGHTRRSLIEIGTHHAPATQPAVQVVDENVDAGSRTLTLENTGDFHAGDSVVITRPCAAQWISDLGMKGFPGTFADQRLDWTPGSRVLIWDRFIAAVDPAHNTITFDAPITTALEKQYGGATISKTTSEMPRHIGVEDLTLDSEFDAANPCDEQHSWIGVAVQNVTDGWLRNVAATHFAGSAVRIGPRARRVSVLNCSNASPISEPAGYRRQSFLVEGQQVLVAHCTSELGMNDFAVGLCAAGPNVFFDCSAKRALGPSGSFESWASGVLYENVRIEGAGIHLTKDMTRAQGGGWTAANSIVSNCKAADFEVRGPESAPNVLINAGPPLYRENESKPAISSASAPSEFIFVPPSPPPPAKPAPPPLQIINGHFVIGDRALWGGAVNDSWWKGEANPNNALNYGVSITRFVPGRDGPGLTEDLPALAQRMVESATPFYQSGPALWYERRRDEHSVNPRLDANVWAPFYELPFARTGQFASGPAWDGQSRYDLTKFNVWYFDRQRAFADLCYQNGLLLYHSLYNTHNVLEWGAHWVDNPWRPSNNVNQTNLPEPPPLEPGDPKVQPNIRLHIANQFYNVDDPSRRALHRAYIFHVLDELGSSPNVVFGVAYQFPGPLEFQQFFLDTVADWEKQNNRTVRVELATARDITDAILADPVRSKLVSVVDLRYWQYRPDGSLWAPPGGKNQAFREFITKDFGKATDFPPATTPEQLYRQVREYHDKYPDKAIVAWNGGVGPAPILFAGGAECLNRNPTAGHSQNTIDRVAFDPVAQQHLSSILKNMAPRDGLLAEPSTNWCLADPSNRNLAVYSVRGNAITFADTLKGTYAGRWINPRTAEGLTIAEPISVKQYSAIAKPTGEEWMLLLNLKSI